MPELNQGDIFKRLREGDFEVAVVLGHIGFNHMEVCWRPFADSEPTLTHIQDPFSEIPNQPWQISSGQWLWFVPAQHNHGMTERELEAVLDEAIMWARTEGHTSIVTNGVANTGHGMDTDANRYSDDQRVQFLIRYSAEKENALGIKIELISLNDPYRFYKLIPLPYRFYKLIPLRYGLESVKVVIHFLLDTRVRIDRQHPLVARTSQSPHSAQQFLPNCVKLAQDPKR